MTRSKSKKPVPASGPPAGTKKAKFIALLRRDEGATIAEMVEATGWLAHSARAMLTRLRKHGLAVEKNKVDGVTRYAIAAEPAA